MSSVAYAHIELNGEGKPVIAGTRTKVLMIARERRAGRDAERIQERFPYLTLGEVHSALAYYYDHQDELDGAMQELDQLEETLKEAQGESPLRREIRERGQPS